MSKIKIVFCSRTNMAANRGSHAAYSSPLTTRYASPEMLYNFSDEKKFSTWRRLWLNLAIAQKQLGLDQISDQALEEMRQNLV